MVHVKDVLADQLLANANDPSWYIPFSDAVKDLSEREAFWKPNEESNSIADCTTFTVLELNVAN